ncbi:MAG: NAD(P)H-binding protein [Candidatus Sericytochromatia bacterium]|nr:NAD(P)H-binding protein [Candidatus Tanganyikabacteria bacterium]
MRLLLLGATGGVGRHLASQAVARGHSGTVLLRPTSSTPEPEGWRIVRGPLDDPEVLDAAMQGADAVLSCIGMQRRNPANPWSRSLSPADLTSSTASHIVSAMQRRGARRIIAVSAAGVGDSQGGLNALVRFFLAATMIGAAYRDLARMEEVYAASGLDWLAPRPTRLREGPASAMVRVVEAFGMGDAISRADVARWMLDALEVPKWPSSAWQGRTPQISGAS